LRHCMNITMHVIISKRCGAFRPTFCWSKYTYNLCKPP
jgi:hypothetical protein